MSYTIDKQKCLLKPNEIFTVYECGTGYCVKIANIQNITNIKSTRISQENQTLQEKIKQVNSSKIQELQELCECDGKKYFIMKYDPQYSTTLKQVLIEKQQSKRKFNTIQVLQIIEQIIEGYICLEMQSIVHQDIQPSNILCNQVNQIFQIKITSFDESFILNQNPTPSSIGNLSYSSPQVVNRENYTQKCDVYSFGIILYQLVYLNLPFNNLNELEQFKVKLEQNKFDVPNIDIEGEEYDKSIIKNILEQTLQYYEQNRISWQNLCQIIKLRPSKGTFLKINTHIQLRYNRIQIAEIILQSLNQQNNQNIQLNQQDCRLMEVYILGFIYHSLTHINAIHQNNYDKLSLETRNLLYEKKKEQVQDIFDKYKNQTNPEFVNEINVKLKKYSQSYQIVHNKYNELINKVRINNEDFLKVNSDTNCQQFVQNCKNIVQSYIEQNINAAQDQLQIILIANMCCFFSEIFKLQIYQDMFTTKKEMYKKQEFYQQINGINLQRLIKNLKS